MLDVKRKFRMSDSALDATAQRVLIGANRDVDVLTPFGFDAIRIGAIAAMRMAFVDLPTDIELSSMMMEATEAKKAKRAEATNYVMMEVMQRVEIRFGSSSAQYRRFGVSGIHNVSDAEFHATLRRVLRCANNLMPQMAAQGLTPAIVGVVSTLTEDFVTLWDAQAQAIEDRDQAVTDRVEAGNALYAELVLLADLGKRKWHNGPESNYNDYVLYPNQGGASDGPEEELQVVEADVAPMAVVNLSLTGIDGTEPITVENTGTAPLNAYFSTMPTDMPPPGHEAIGPASAFSSSVAAMGYMAGVREYLNVYNAGPGPGQVRVTVLG